MDRFDWFELFLIAVVLWLLLSGPPTGFWHRGI